MWALSLNELEINEKLNNFLETNDPNEEFSVESMLRLRINYKSNNSDTSDLSDRVQYFEILSHLSLF